MPDCTNILNCCPGGGLYDYEVDPSSQVYLRTQASPEDGGTTTGDGNFDIGDSVTVEATAEVPTTIDVGVDIVFCCDESAAMTDIGTIMTDVVTGLEQRLNDEGIGSGTVANRYALVNFGRSTTATEEFPFQDYTSFLAALPGIALYGGASPNEDAYDAIDYAVNQMTWRDQVGVTKLIFFITDEDRNFHYYANGADQDAQFINLKAELVAGGFLLAGMHNCMNGRLRDGSNVVACAADYTGKAYIADGSGGYTESTGANNAGTFSNGDTATYPLTGQKEEYYDLLMDSEVQGYFFDLISYREGGNTADSVIAVIVPALADRIVQELVWTFVGWFNAGGDLVSENETYTFTILNNTILTARFEYAT